ncbi:HD domain-containing protein, partial [Candidatus Bathyarchaeota archaeon]|nr:HD domain-containing protein [Candidatus Bathyarchaeota archaeon]
MTIVSPHLIHKHLRKPHLRKVFNFLENDVETQTYLQMANVMAVERLRYNDHGPVHSRITSGSALEIFEILSRRFTPTTVRDGVCGLEDAKVAVLCGAYLHDIGNAIHRDAHHMHGCIIASPILDRLLSKIYPTNR